MMEDVTMSYIFKETVIRHMTVCMSIISGSVKAIMWMLKKDRKVA